MLYEERLKLKEKMGLEKWREKKLFIRGVGRRREHEYKLKKKILGNAKNLNFPNRSISIWNGLDMEMVIIHKFKIELDNTRYRCKTAKT